MRIMSRIRFMFGILFVIFLVGALTYYLNTTMSIAQSSRAELAADSIAIGTDYAGLVVKQFVEEGDKVKKGQTLFEIESPQLKEALASQTVSPTSLSFQLNPANNNILLSARDDGVIQKIMYHQGSYVTSGVVVVTVNTVGSLHVVANFHLSPPDYARLNKESKVDLVMPDNSKQQATIFAITLVRDGDVVDTVVKARMKDADISDFRFSVGTPVQATLHLNQDSWFQGLFDLLRRLFIPSGR
jgi:hypothetical protein